MRPSQKQKKFIYLLDVVAHTYNPSAHKAEAGGIQHI